MYQNNECILCVPLKKYIQHNRQEQLEERKRKREIEEPDTTEEADATTWSKEKEETADNSSITTETKKKSSIAPRSKTTDVTRAHDTTTTTA